jgi:hypothetical protein
MGSKPVVARCDGVGSLPALLFGATAAVRDPAPLEELAPPPEVVEPLDPELDGTADEPLDPLFDCPADEPLDPVFDEGPGEPLDVEG